MPEQTPTERIHCAFTTYTAKAQEDWAEQIGEEPSPRQWWVSIDGEHWLPVNRPPVADTTVDGLRALFEPRDDGQGRRMHHMNYARRYLHWAVDGQMPTLYIGGAFMPNGWYATSEDIEKVEV